jgi:hypothetical protein
VSVHQLFKQINKSVALGLVAIASVLGLTFTAVAPASAWAVVTHLGSADCRGTLLRWGTLGSLTSGSLVHQLSHGVGYTEYGYQNGSNIMWRRSSEGGYFSWATIGSSTGLYDLSWGCTKAYYAP